MQGCGSEVYFAKNLELSLEISETLNPAPKMENY